MSVGTVGWHPVLLIISAVSRHLNSTQAAPNASVVVTVITSADACHKFMLIDRRRRHNGWHPCDAPSGRRRADLQPGRGEPGPTGDKRRTASAMTARTPQLSCQRRRRSDAQSASPLRRQLPPAGLSSHRLPPLARTPSCRLGTFVLAWTQYVQLRRKSNRSAKA